MSAPTVACVMLANGRPEMVKRAVECFRAQMYPGARLMIWDSGPRVSVPYTDGIFHCFPGQTARSIGTLRNEANEAAGADIIVHFDSDDWSHPNRIAEQVALLQSNGAECVGYNEMLFWEYGKVGYRDIPSGRYLQALPGEAWLYRASVQNYTVGTSMCYWRETWERHPFPDRSEGCDDLEWFNRGVKIDSMSSIPIGPRQGWPLSCRDNFGESPRMIASIHDGNTCAKIEAKAREWTRVPEWDDYAREEMKL